MHSSHPLIQDHLIDEAALDALVASLHKHAQAHRDHKPTHPSDPIPAQELKHLLDPLFHNKASPFSKLVDGFFGRLEKIPRPFLNLRFKVVAAYHFFGITGIVTACITPLILGLILNLSLLTLSILLATSALLTWAYIKLTILITKKDAVVFFNYFLTLLTGSFLVLRIMNQPVLVYMDIMIVGAGLLFAFGRIGCFMAGCCYGKPSLKGIRYDKHHKKNGFPRLLLRVRLLPVQLIESAWLFGITTVSIVIVFSTQAPGMALSTFLILLALGRLMLEFFRGDLLRPYKRGVSQAQWTSLVMLGLTLSLQIAGILPFQSWQSFILVSFLILLITFVLRSKNVSLRSLFSARHIHEIAEVFEIFKRGSLIPASTQKAVHLRKTSLNIQLSENYIPLKDRTTLYHITLSSLDTPFHYRQAEGLSQYMVSLHKQAGMHVLLPDHDNIYHLLHFTIDTR